MKISFHQSTSTMHRCTSALHELWGPQVIPGTQAGSQKAAGFPRKHQEKCTQGPEGDVSARFAILMAVVLAPGGSWSHRAISENRQPAAKRRQDKPPNTPHSHSEQHLSSEDANIPCRWLSPEPSPFFACPTVLQAQTWVRAALTRSLSDCGRYIHSVYVCI